MLYYICAILICILKHMKLLISHWCLEPFQSIRTVTDKTVASPNTGKRLLGSQNLWEIIAARNHKFIYLLNFKARRQLRIPGARSFFFSVYCRPFGQYSLVTNILSFRAGSDRSSKRSKDLSTSHRLSKTSTTPASDTTGNWQSNYSR